MSAAQLRELVNGAKPICSERPEPKIETGPRELNITDMASRVPEPPRFIVPAWLPAGEVTMLGGHGGTGKSAIALHLAVCIALGIDFYGAITERRRTSYVSFEDSEAVLHWRLSRICNALGIDMVALDGRLRIFDGATCATTWFAKTPSGDQGVTPDMMHIKDRLGGSEFIVVDGSSDVFSGNENDRSQVKAFLRSLRTLIPADGALLLLAHVDKQGAKSGASSLGFSGSTGWHNGVRCRWFLYAETQGDDDDQVETGNVCLEVRKSNLGRSGASMKLRYDDDAGVFVRLDTVSSVLRKSSVLREAEESAAIKTAIRAAYDAGNAIPSATTGTRSAHAVLQAHQGFPESLRGRRGKARFYQMLERMRASGELITEAQRKANRHYSEVLNAPF